MITAKQAQSLTAKKLKEKERKEKELAKEQKKKEQRLKKELLLRMPTIIKDIETQIKHDIEKGENKSNYHCGENFDLCQKLKKILEKNGYLTKIDSSCDLNSDGCSTSTMYYNLRILWGKDEGGDEGEL